FSSATAIARRTCAASSTSSLAVASGGIYDGGGRSPDDGGVMSQPQATPGPGASTDLPLGDERPHRSAMSRRFGFVANVFAGVAFRYVRMDEADVTRLRRLADQGTLVYVMRYRSLVDYFLVNYLLLREGLPLPLFTNDISSLWLRPVRDMVAGLWEMWRRRHRGEGSQARRRDLVARLTAHGRSVLLFIRSSRRGPTTRNRTPQVVREARPGADYLRDIVHGLWGKEQPVFLVP